MSCYTSMDMNIHTVPLVAKPLVFTKGTLNQYRKSLTWGQIYPAESQTAPWVYPAVCKSPQPVPGKSPSAPVGLWHEHQWRSTAGEGERPLKLLWEHQPDCKWLYNNHDQWARNPTIGHRYFPCTRGESSNDMVNLWCTNILDKTVTIEAMSSCLFIHC